MVPCILLLLLGVANASFCGKSGVPFSVEVLPSGAPVLGCAQPSCLAQPAGNTEDSVFNADASGQIDGFFREGSNLRQGYLQTNKLRANCTDEFDQLACSRKNQWVGGIDYLDHSRQPLLLQCCTFEGLRFSQIVGVTPIGPGEAVTGGEVVRDGRQISFDVIANIRKVVNSGDPNTISYEVAVRRMNCLPDPPEIEITVDEDVELELVQVLQNANNGSVFLGHTGHPHLEREKKQDKTWRREIKSRKKTRDDERSYGHAQLMERPGSFGTPTFNPTSDTKQKPQYSGKLYHLEEKPKPLAIEAPTFSITTVAPLFTFPTIPTYTFPTISPPPQLFLFGQFNHTPPPRVLSSPSSAPSSGPLRPILTSRSFTSLFEQSHRVQPQVSPLMQSARPNIYQSPQQNYVADKASLHKQNRTKGNLFSLYNIHAHVPTDATPATSQRTGMSIYTPAGTAQRKRKRTDLLLLWQQQFFNLFRPALVTQAPSAQMSKQTTVLDINEKSELVEPSIPPVQQHLGILYQPPPFSALTSALQNFQAQG